MDMTKEKTNNQVAFNFAELLYLKYLSKQEIIDIYRISKRYRTILSKSASSRAVKRLIELGIIKKINPQNYKSKYKRLINVEDLGIIVISLEDDNTLEMQ